MTDTIAQWFQKLLSGWGWWYAVGFVGQVVFGTRFVIQWIASERKKQSVIPIHFWYFSLTGSLLLLTYAIGRIDPVFIFGQLFNSFIYVRNLMLIRRTKTTVELHGLIIK